MTLAGAPGNNTLSGFNIGNCTPGTAIAGSNGGTCTSAGTCTGGAIQNAAVGISLTTTTNQRFVNAKFNDAFVMMEYFGYLRRDADASGFAFWLNKLNEFGGNFEQTEMVKAFIVSSEYRGRFPR